MGVGRAAGGGDRGRCIPARTQRLEQHAAEPYVGRCEPTVATDAGRSQAVAACTAYARPYSTDDEITALQFETNRLAAEAAVANPRWEPLRDAFVDLIELQQPRTAGEQASLGEFSAVLSEARARCLDAGGLDIGGSTG